MNRLEFLLGILSMPFIRHKQRAITAASPVKGQGRWINPSKGRNLLTYDQLVVRAQLIKDTAGVPSDITPGWTTAPGFTGTPQVSAAVLITDAATALSQADSGTGSQNDPYVFTNRVWSNQADPFVWNDTDADYYVKISESSFTDAGGSLLTAFVQSDSPTRIDIEATTFNKPGGSGRDHILISGTGDLAADRVLSVASVSSILVKQTTGICSFIDSEWSDSGSNYGGGNEGLFRNETAGGAIDQTRCTFTWQDATSSNQLYYSFQQDCSILMDSCLISSKVNADHTAVPATPPAIGQGLRQLIDTSPTSTMVPLRIPKIFRNSEIYGGTGPIWAGGVPTALAVDNLTIERCDLYHAATGAATFGVKLLSLGKTPVSAATPPGESPDNVRILWCKVDKADDGSIDNGLAGNEALEIFGGANCEMAFCYIVSAPEDACEFHFPRTNNSIHDIVGGNAGTISGVRNQIADIFAGFGAPEFSSAGSSIYHIFGRCGSDAADFVNTQGPCTWHDVLVDNSENITAAPANAAVGNTVLFSDFAGFPSLTTGRGFMTQASQSANSLPYVDEAVPSTNSNSAVEAPAIIPT